VGIVEEQREEREKVRGTGKIGNALGAEIREE
jgi:hypothetical protein